MTRTLRFSLVGLAVIGGIATAAYLWQSDPANANGLLPYQDADRIAKGADIYEDACASCHGDQLQGEPNWRERDADGYLPAPPHDETGHTWHHPDAQLIQIVALGTEAIVGNGYQSKMIGFADSLEPHDIVDVLAFIKSTWPDHIILRHNDFNTRAGQ
ncbi:cytochrome c [uncultured Pelagimonas sp.]|uniref:c-type cytochrome n=1 Tax=uncultured Pelagimonas sp. TaxID=1618102 RepID=UPI00261175CB|nr:cytochrome c [uncultured Pelagimonas sp.]